MVTHIQLAESKKEEPYESAQSSLRKRPTYYAREICTAATGGPRCLRMIRSRVPQARGAEKIGEPPETEAGGGAQRGSERQSAERNADAQAARRASPVQGSPTAEGWGEGAAMRR